MPRSRKANRSADPFPIEPSPGITINGEGHDEFGNRYFRVAVNNNRRQLLIRADRLGREAQAVFSELNNAGWNGYTTTTKNAVLKLFETSPSMKSHFEVATRIGWIQTAYILPYKIIGKATAALEPSLGGLDAAMTRKYRCRGSLTQWKSKIARPSDGNTRLMFAISLAFTGPILRFFNGPQGGGFQLFGNAQSGKTTAALLAGSVWGCHRTTPRNKKGFIESWNTTLNTSESTMLAHNDSILILDETKHAGKDARERADIILKTLMRLSEQVAKERMTATGPAAGWRGYFLSTSNDTTSRIASLGHRQIEEAELSRLTDIPLPDKAHGIFDTVQQFSSGSEFADDLKRHSLRYFGTPAKRYIKRLVKDVAADKAHLKRRLERYRKRYTCDLAAETVGEGLHSGRATDKFSIVYAAGCLAIRYKILPWSRGDLRRAILRCQLDSIKVSASMRPDPSATDAQRKKLFDFIIANRTKLVDLSNNRLKLGTPLNALGYLARFRDERWVYLMPSTFHTAVGSPRNARVMLEQLVNEGLMEKPKSGWCVQRPIFEGGGGNRNCARVYAFSARLFRL